MTMLPTLFIIILNYGTAPMFCRLRNRSFTIGWNFSFHHAKRSAYSCADVKDDISCLGMPARHTWIDSWNYGIFVARAILGTSKPTVVGQIGVCAEDK